MSSVKRLTRYCKTVRPWASLPFSGFRQAAKRKRLWKIILLLARHAELWEWGALPEFRAASSHPFLFSLILFDSRYGLRHKGATACFIVHSARDACNIQELEVIVICSLHFLNTGFKPDENQIRDHQAELEGAYNELLQLAAARRARLDESHKLQTFYRDAEEEEMWVSEKAHSLQSTDYGHDLNSAMVLLNKHEVWECKNPLRLVWKISWIIREFPGCRWVGYAVVDWQGWFAYVLFNVHLSCGDKGVGVDWLTFRGEFGCGG